MFESSVIAAYESLCVPVAQWWSIALAAQTLWVRFPGNTHTDKKQCIA